MTQPLIAKLNPNHSSLGCLETIFLFFFLNQAKLLSVPFLFLWLRNLAAKLDWLGDRQFRRANS